MGDVGALALGGALGVIAVIVRQELVLAIMGGVFVVETLSVMIQTTYYKRTHGKRIFLMAPIHHHFELKGWSETQGVTRFWIITMILVLVGLATLKIRWCLPGCGGGERKWKAKRHWFSVWERRDTRPPFIWRSVDGASV